MRRLNSPQPGSRKSRRSLSTQAVEAVKKSRLCRLLCGRAQPFRTAELTVNSLGSAACRKAVGFPHSKRRSRRRRTRDFFTASLAWAGIGRPFGATRDISLAPIRGMVSDSGVLYSALPWTVPRDPVPTTAESSQAEIGTPSGRGAHRAAGPHRSRQPFVPKCRNSTARSEKH